MPAWTACARRGSADRELARLDWNRVQLYVWPPVDTVDAPVSELDQVIRSLAARTGALGLEQVLSSSVRSGTALSRVS